MASETSDEDSLYAEVGNFYFTTESLHDVEFIVGEKQEKIKAVRLPLINQSKVWWSMLCQDSPLAEKGEIHVTDIEPNIFKLLLRHSYGGLDSLDEFSEEEIMKLCYCANKYMMKSLMKKIATRLLPGDVDRVFPALHCLVYFNLKDVEENVQKLVQRHTTKIFEHPEFLECDVESVTYICKQETLNCDEVTLWKSMILWAKHKAKNEEGSKLREWLSQPLQHIRLLVMSKDELHEHVFPLDVLSGSELVAICKGDLSAVTTLCSEKAKRSLAEGPLKDITFEVYHNLRKSGCISTSETSESFFTIKDETIELKSVVCRSTLMSKSGLENRKDYAYADKYAIDKITVTITNEDPLVEESISIELKDFKVFYLDRFTIPTIINNRGIALSAESKYKVGITFISPKSVPCLNELRCEEGHNFSHGMFYCSKKNGCCHIQQFTYCVIRDRETTVK